MLKNHELARKVHGAIECRSEALRVTWKVRDLTSADSHSLECAFSCSVRIADSAADRKMFAEVFLSALDVVTTQTLIDHFMRSMRAVMAELATGAKAADVTGAVAPAEWIARIRNAIEPVAFASGLELLAPYHLEIESSSLQRQRLEELSRTRNESRAAGQMQQLQRAGELLKQFQLLRQTAPELPAGKLLEQISPNERGTTLQTLLLAASQEHASARKTLYAVSGHALLQIDAGATPPKVTLIPLPQDLGPLRSVQSNSRSLLIGARGGVLGSAIEDPSQASLYKIPGLDSQLGFNAVVETDTEIWASHGEAGIVGWSIGQMDSPLSVYAEAAVPVESPAGSNHSILASTSLRTAGGGRMSGAKNLLSLDGRTLLYSVGNELIHRDGSDRTALPIQSAAEIISLIPTEQIVIAVHQDGTIGLMDRMTRQWIDVRKRSGRFSAAGAMPWLGDLRLLLASEDGPIDCIGLEDPVVTEYLSPYRGLKILAARSDLIAAVSPDRQRIVIWNTHDWQRPAGEVHVTSLSRHRIADIEFSQK